MPPHCSRVFATRFSSCALSEMRAATAIASPPLARIAAATSSHGSWLRDEITTLAPASAKASAIALPMPREDPVTIATFPVRSNRFIICLLYASRLAERPLENLVHIAVAERLQRLRPLPCHAAACRRRAARFRPSRSAPCSNRAGYSARPGRVRRRRNRCRDRVPAAGQSMCSPAPSGTRPLRATARNSPARRRTTGRSYAG